MPFSTASTGVTTLLDLPLAVAGDLNPGCRIGVLFGEQLLSSQGPRSFSLGAVTLGDLGLYSTFINPGAFKVVGGSNVPDDQTYFQRLFVASTSATDSLLTMWLPPPLWRTGGQLYVEYLWERVSSGSATTLPIFHLVSWFPSAAAMNTSDWNYSQSTRDVSVPETNGANALFFYHTSASLYVGSSEHPGLLAITLYRYGTYTSAAYYFGGARVTMVRGGGSS